MFHWKGGWFFKRNSDFSVTISKEGDSQVTATVPADEWASIVATVSVLGETLETWAAAKFFHLGKGAMIYTWVCKECDRELDCDCTFTIPKDYTQPCHCPLGIDGAKWRRKE